MVSRKLLLLTAAVMLCGTDQAIAQVLLGLILFGSAAHHHAARRRDARPMS